MPWHVEDDNPECSGYAVVKDSDGEIEGCHDTKAEANAQLAALYASEESAMPDVPDEETRTAPPAEGYRAISWPAEYREEPDRPPRLVGHFARFDTFNEIDSATEGRFMERIAPGAFKKTFAENRRIKVLFQHGRDPALGEQPIAKVTELREDRHGPYYEAELLEGVPPLILDGLRKGVYGVSYRFKVDPARDEYVRNPGKSPANPNGLPERTIRQAWVYEFGPVTFPADAGADVAVRSLSDEMSDPIPPRPVAPSDGAEAEPHPVPERSDEPEPVAAMTPKERAPVADISSYRTLEEMAARVHDLNAEIERAAEIPGVLPEAEQAAFDAKVDERAQLDAAMTAWRQRREQVRVGAERGNVEMPVPQIIRKPDPGTIYDVPRLQRDSRSRADFSSKLRDSAMRSIEGASFANSHFPRQTGQTDVAALVDGRDQCEPDEVAKRVLYTGSPSYRRAFRKWLFQQTMTPEEQSAFEESRAALVTLANVAVPYDLDTTMQINTAGAINPYREAFRVVKTTSNDWRPLVSSGMTAVYQTEATAATDLSPAFTAPARLLQKAHTLARFSTEIQSDYPGLEAELAKEISDAKDVLESVQFTTGAGTTIYPQGIFTAFTANFLDTTTTLVIVPADLYKLEANIGARYRAGCVWLGSPYFYSLVRGIDTAGGAGLWVDNLTQGGAVGNTENGGRLGNLLGHPAYEVGGLPDGTMATTEKVAILANRERFVVIDRIGMNLELIPNFLDAGTGFPTGERMLYAWWRNTSVGIGLATLGAGRAACIFRGK